MPVDTTRTEARRTPETVAPGYTGPPPPFRYLEPECRLSRSVLWDLQRELYAALGRDAWGDGIVPTQITSNPFAAHAFARTVTGFLRDWCAGRLPGDPTRPIYLVDLCSGSGQLAAGMARALQRLTAPLDPRPDIRVVLTDLSERNVAAAVTDPQLQPLFASGCLDTALFDTERPAPLDLRISGERLTPESQPNPLVVTAAYAFDSVPHDAFHAGDGVVSEIRVRAAVPASAPEDLGARETIAALRLHQRRHPIEGAYYGDPVLDRVLRRCGDRLENAEFQLPVGGIGATRFLARLSRRGALAICGDKAYTDLRQIEGDGTLHVAKHGTVSLMVNLHAVGLVAAELGGWACHEPGAAASYTASVFWLPARRGEAADLPETKLAYDDALAGFTPRHYMAMADEVAERPDAGLPAVLRLLYLGAFDPWVFRQHYQTIRDAAVDATPEERARLTVVLDGVWANYGHVRKTDDLPFKLGSCYYNLGLRREALRCYEVSLRDDGDHPITWCNIGQCHAALGDDKAAKAAYHRSLELDVQCHAAQEGLARLGD